MHDTKPSQRDASVEHRESRVYATPVLKVYGPVAALTGAVDMTGMADGGPSPNTRT